MITSQDLLALRLGRLWRFFWAQGFAFWAMCMWLVLEYVRPQQRFALLEAVPVGQIALGAALLGHLVSGRGFAVKGVGSWLLLLFTAVIVLSSFTADNPSVAIQQWRLWFSWIAIYFLIINVVNSEQRLVVFTVLWLLVHFYLSQGAARQFATAGFHVHRVGRDWSAWLVQQLGRVRRRDVHVPRGRMALLPGSAART